MFIPFPLRHGGNVWEAERNSQYNYGDFLDFSSNINPFGPPAEVAKVLPQGIKKIVHYPDPDYVRLRTALARFLKVKPAAILVGNGLSQLIDLVAFGENFSRAIILNPTYGEYEQACSKHRLPITHLYCREEDNFMVPWERLSASLNEKGKAIIFICNPNNPTGVFIPASSWHNIFKKVSSGNHRLIVDEAFIDFTPAGRRESLAPKITLHPQLVVLWSLTKIFSLPGLRLGVAISHKRIIEKLKDFISPWSVNIMAEEAALASLSDTVFLEKTRQRLAGEREYLFEHLRKIKGLTIYPSQANFFLVKILSKNRSAGRLAQYLFNHRILIRDCSNFRSLDGHFFRLAVKDRASHKVLISALTKYFK